MAGLLTEEPKKPKKLSKKQLAGLLADPVIDDRPWVPDAQTSGDFMDMPLDQLVEQTVPEQEQMQQMQQHMIVQEYIKQLLTGGDKQIWKAMAPNNTIYYNGQRPPAAQGIPSVLMR